MSIIDDDLVERSVEIHWPDDAEPASADLFAHNAIVIEGSAEKIWATLVDAATWPGWYSNADDVVINHRSGLLVLGATFTWRTFGLHITSTIAEFVPHSRISWYGSGDQLRAYHAWLLIRRGPSSTYVVMEEVGIGERAQELARTNPGHMHRGHELWNVSLKFVVEGG